MAPRPPVAVALRLACHQFAESEVEALRSLLRLLAPHLRRPCDVVPASADGVALLLVNLDHPEPQPPPLGPRCVGCAVKPRLKPVGCIHRPLRAAELLALLSEAAPAPTPALPIAAAPDVPALHFRLRAWPLDLTDWSPRHWRALATITRLPLDAHEIARRSGLPPEEVERLLQRLADQALLERTVQRTPVAPSATQPAWRNLAARVGQLFGFAR